MSTLTAPAPDRTKVLAGSAIALLMGGALYSFSVFAPPFSELRGWAVPDIMFAFGLTSMLAPVVMIASGFLVDRGYARQLMLAGGILYGLGYVGGGLTDNLTMFYLSYGIVTGVGQGIMYAVALSNTMKFYPDKRGFASGIITGGMGAGSALFAPLGRALISAFGVSQAFIILGVVFAVAVALVALFLTQPCPPGYTPPGWTPPAAAGGRPGGFRHLDWKGMISTIQFWIMMPVFICGAFFGLMITSNLSPIGQGMFGLSAGTAALYVSLLAVFNALGRIAWGTISDRIGILASLMAVFVIAAGALVLLGTARGIVVLTIGVVVLGFGFGGIMSLFPPLTMSNFGPKNQGVNYGIVFSAYALSGLVAPRWGASIAQANDGDFSQAFLIAAGIAVLGLVLTLVYRAVDRSRPVQGRPVEAAPTPAPGAEAPGQAAGAPTQS